MLVVSADLAPLARQIAAGAPSIERLVVIDASDVVATGSPGGPMVCALEPLLAQARGDDDLGRVRRDRALRTVLHLGHHRRAEGRDLHASLQLPAHAAVLAGGCHGITARDSVLTVVPMFHANAWGVPFAAPAAGAKLVLPGRHPTARSLATLINAEGVTIGVGIATVWLDLVEHIDQAGGELPTLERHHGRRCAAAAGTDGAHRKPPGSHRFRPAGA